MAARKRLLPYDGLRLCLLLLPLAASCRREAPPSARTPTASERDVRDLVRRPKEPWRPEPGAPRRRLSLLLLTDKSKIRKGEAFHYRLEMRNTGLEPLLFKEASPSFVKDGSLCGGAFSFFATPPRGKERRLPCALAADFAGAGLDLALDPGDFLLTRGAGAAGGFRDLPAPHAFDALGVHRVRAEYSPPDGPRSASNAVTVEVVP